MQSTTAFKLLVFIPTQLVISIILYGAWELVSLMAWPSGQVENSKWVLLPLAVWGIQFVYFLQKHGFILNREGSEMSEESPEKPPTA